MEIDRESHNKEVLKMMHASMEEGLPTVLRMFENRRQRLKSIVNDNISDKEKINKILTTVAKFEDEKFEGSDYFSVVGDIIINLKGLGEGCFSLLLGMNNMLAPTFHKYYFMILDMRTIASDKNDENKIESIKKSLDETHFHETYF